MKILLTGKNGQIGWELERILHRLGEVISTGRDDLDLADAEQIRDKVRQVQPDLIVNAAAYTAVDGAQDHKETAMAVNGVAPGILAREAKQLKAALIHYSTDYVFDGKKKSGPYTEEDATHPINAYGETKLAGERAVQEAGIPYLILRTSGVYGSRGKNFLRTIQKLAGEREELKVVDDQILAPTWCRSIAEATVKILTDHLATGPFDGESVFAHASGIYHLTCGGETNWHGFTKAILEGSGRKKNPRLTPIPTSEYPTPAARPEYSVLSNAKARIIFGVQLPNWEDALQQCLLDNQENLG